MATSDRAEIGDSLRKIAIFSVLLICVMAVGCGGGGGPKAKAGGFNRGGDDPDPVAATETKSPPVEPAIAEVAARQPSAPAESPPENKSGGAPAPPEKRPRIKKTLGIARSSAPGAAGKSQVDLDVAGPLRGRQFLLRRSELSDGSLQAWVLTTSLNEGKPEFPAVFFHFHTVGEDADQLAGLTVKGTLFIQKSQTSPIYYSSTEFPAEVTFSDCSDDQAIGEFLSVRLSTSDGPEQIACQGRFTAVRNAPQTSVESVSDEN